MNFLNNLKNFLLNSNYDTKVCISKFNHGLLHLTFEHQESDRVHRIIWHSTCYVTFLNFYEMKHYSNNEKKKEKKNTDSKNIYIVKLPWL
jgi:hypothetical protein